MLYIQEIEVTPNPNALKFILNEMLLLSKKRFFDNKNKAAKDPLAKRIFEIDGIKSVFYSDKFITLEKYAAKNWPSIQKQFNLILRTFDLNMIPLENLSPVSIQTEDIITLDKIKDIIERKIKPGLSNDGGGINIMAFKNNNLMIRYLGACASCPTSIHGTLHTIENLLKREINSSIKVSLV